MNMSALPERVTAYPGAVAHGYSIGMLCAQWNVPFVPGDLNNATTFDYAIRYLQVDGLSGADILRGNGERYIDLLVTAARRLETEGVRAITSNCGFMAGFQEVVAASVNVPVFLSSLLQLPMITQMVGPGRRVGVLAANSAAVTPVLLQAAGLTDTERIVVQGLENYEHFNEVILQELGTMEPQRFAEEVVQGAVELQRANPDLGAFLLECSDLPAYSAAIQQATGLPVFDWATFIDYVHRAVVPRTYSGIY